MTYDNRADEILQAIYLTDPPDDIHFDDSNAWLLDAEINGSNDKKIKMNTPSREEIDAKLETISVRMDGRVASIEAKIDGFTGRLEEKFGRMDDRMQHIETASSETQASLKGLKSTIIITAVSTVLAIVLGVAAFNATVLSNMVASFESGKNTAAAQAEVKRQSEETAALLKQIQQDINTNKK